jgi:putative ABC transport system permease protein
MHETIAPLIMQNNPYGGLIIKTKTKEMAGLLATLETNWKSFNTGEPFSYALLNQLYNETYLTEQKMGRILEIFAVLTVFVACLGLFGLVTFIIAFPLGFYLMDKWLEDFAYRINIQWWVFALAGIIVVSIALFTISFKTIKSALVNPVDSLRSE